MGLLDRLSLASRALVGTMPANMNPLDPNPASPGRLLSGILPGGIGMPPKRGSREFLEAFSQSPLLRMVTSRIADAVAAVQWQLFVYRPGSNGDAVKKAQRHDLLRRMGPLQRKTTMASLRDSGDLTEIAAHPFLDLLDRANEYHTGYGVRKLSQIGIDTIGEFFWLKERNGVGAPTGIWPLPAPWILSTPTPTHRFYRVSFRGWQGEIPDTEIFWAMDLDPAFPYGRGTGTGNALADDLETDKYAAIMTKQKFFNHMRPDILITAEGISDADTRRLERSWSQRHQGFWQVAKAAFLNRHVDVHEFGVELRSQQFVQLREFERNLVAQVYGVPPEILGVLENSNRSTITAAETIFAKFVLVPRLEFWRAQLQERFLPEYDDRLLLDYVSPVPDDVETELEAAKVAPWAMSLDEWRARMGLEPIPDGKGESVHVMPLGATAIPVEDLLNPQTQAEKDQAAADLAAQAPKLPPAGGNGNGGPPKPKPAVAPASQKDERIEWWASLARDAGIFRDARDFEMEAWAFRRREAVTSESALHAIADQLEPRLRAAFLRAVEASRAAIDLDRIAGMLQSGQIDAAAAQAGVAALTHGLAGLTPVLQAGFAGGGQYAAQALTAAGIAISFDLTNPRAQEWAGRYSSQLITGISEDTRAGIRRLIEQAFADGLHPYETARRVKDWVGLTARQQDAVASFASRLHEQGVDPEKVEARAARYAGAQLRYRAQMIARTETLASSNHGQQELWQQAWDRRLLTAERTQRVWLVTEDDRLDTRICEPMAEQRVGLDQPFTTGEGDSLMVPPAHPHCRCTVGLEIT